MREQIVLTSVSHVLSYLGEETVLIPVKRGTKQPIPNNWTKLDAESIEYKKYRKQLDFDKYNIGVVLGRNSSGICSVDIDEDNLIQPFLSLNPFFNETLSTKGKRGANFWFRANGEIPKLEKIRGVGELRGQGGQTLIAGIHPDGMNYRIIQDCPVINCDAAGIKFPSPFSSSVTVSVPVTASITTLTTKSTPTHYTYMAHDKGDSKVNLIRLIGECRKREEKWKKQCQNLILMEHYENFIEDSFELNLGIRNSILVELTTSLFDKVSFSISEDLVAVFYDNYSPIFKDSKLSHMDEYASLVKGIKETYYNQLSSEENEIIKLLNPVECDVFRICRSLAKYSGGHDQFPNFFLSCQCLAKRIGKDEKTAFRLMKRFQGMGILKVQKRGSKRIKGKRGKATIWMWNL